MPGKRKQNQSDPLSCIPLVTMLQLCRAQFPGRGRRTRFTEELLLGRHRVGQTGVGYRQSEDSLTYLLRSC